MENSERKLLELEDIIFDYLINILNNIKSEQD